MTLPPNLKQAAEGAAGEYECATQHPEREWNENDYKYRDFLAGWSACLAHLAKDAGEFDIESASGAARRDGRVNEYDFLLGARWQHAQMAATIGALRAELEDLRATEKVYRMNREWIEGAKEEIARLTKELAEAKLDADKGWA